MHFEDRNQFIDSLNRYSLLIIDDLGIERNSEFALKQVFNVIDNRNIRQDNASANLLEAKKILL